MGRLQKPAVLAGRDVVGAVTGERGGGEREARESGEHESDRRTGGDAAPGGSQASGQQGGASAPGGDAAAKCRAGQRAGASRRTASDTHAR